MRAALYARVSTPLKLERQNPDTQLLPLRQFATAHGWTVRREYVDDTSAVKQRPQFKQLLEDARRREFDVVVVVKLDRMFRSLEEFVHVVRMLTRHGLRFICVDQSIDTDRNDPAGQLLMHILAAVAEFERALISERVRAGIARVRAQGKPWGGKPPKRIDLDVVRRLQSEGWSLKKIGLHLNCYRGTIAQALKAAAETATNGHPKTARVPGPD